MRICLGHDAPDVLNMLSPRPFNRLIFYIPAEEVVVHPILLQPFLFFAVIEQFLMVFFIPGIKLQHQPQVIHVLPVLFL